MTAFSYILFLFCFAYSAALNDTQEDPATSAPPTKDVATRELTDTGYVIRYNDRLYSYPLRVSPLFIRQRPPQQNPTDSNTIETDDEDSRRPLFYFTAYEPLQDSTTPKTLPGSRPYIEIRKKREVPPEDIPESSKVGKLRRKRTYCGKCGGRGYGVSYVPVTYVVYPVYPSYYGGGGGGKGCYSCGGYGGGGGGGGGGSFSYSSSSSQSSAGSFGWGK